MKVGNLVYVSGTATGDSPWVVELYRSRDPVLVLELGGENHEWAKVFDKGREKYLRPSQLTVIET